MGRKIISFLYDSVCSVIRENDSFSSTIVFTHKGKNTFKTVFGGFWTFLIMILLILYGYSLFLIMVNRKGSNISRSTSVVNLNSDTTFHYPGLTDFTFVLSVTDRTLTTLPISPSMFDIEIQQTLISKTGSVLTVSKTTLSLKIWDATDFKTNGETYAAQLSGTYSYCPVEKDWMIKGNFGNEEFYYLEISLVKWSSGCLSDVAIAAALAGGRFTFMFLNSYVDFSDYEQPIKTYLDDRYSFYIKTDIKKNVRAHVRNNYVNLMDSLLDIGSEVSSSFYSIEKTDTDIYDIFGNTFIEIDLTVDPNVDTYERKVYSFFDLTGQLGGLYEVLHTIIGIIVSIVSSRILIFTMMSNLYYINIHKEKKDVTESCNIKGTKVFSTMKTQKELTYKNDITNLKRLNLWSSTTKPIYQRNPEILSTDVKIQDFEDEWKSPNFSKVDEIPDNYGIEGKF